MPKTIDPSDPTVQTAVFGREVEDFLTSDIGRYLVQRALNEEQVAVAELIKDPQQRKSNQNDMILRNRIYVARAFRGWLEEAFNEGLQAMDLLKENESV